MPGSKLYPVLGVRTAQVFTVSLSWVRPKANGGRPGHVSHPPTTSSRFNAFTRYSGRCLRGAARPGLKPRVYSLCFLGPFCGTAEAVPSYLSQMETASGFLYSLCSAHLLDPRHGKRMAGACLPHA